MTTETFLLRVTAQVPEPDPEEPDFAPEVDPQDFAAYLRKRYVVPAGTVYALDAYNKDSHQLIIDIEVIEP